MPKQLSFNIKKVLKGLDQVADAVTATLGPNGRNVMFGETLGGIPTYEITNDGVTVANRIVLEDNEEDAGAYIIRNISSQSNDDVGDGTTTTTLLTQELIHECLKRPENPMKIRTSLKETSEKILKQLKKASIKLKKEDIEKVALISAEDKHIAGLITQIINKLGNKAVINVEDSKTYITDYEIVDGFESTTGFMSPLFATEKKNGKAIYENIPVLVARKKISNIIDIQPIFEQFKTNKISQCVIVCEDIEDGMLGLLIQNKLAGLFNSLVIRAGGEMLEDYAGVTGAKIVADNTGVNWQNITLDDLGQANKIISDANKTFILGNGYQSKAFADKLEKDLGFETNMYIKEKNQVRIARLRGGMANLRIAAATDTERAYLRRKAEDAVKATQAALEDGIIEGGGIAFWNIAQNLKEETIGEQILKKVLTAPLRKIVENSGKDYAEIIKNMPKGQGYDAKNNKYVEMVVSGIIDPAKVSITAIENAVSAAGIFITTHAVITDIDKK
jgi:chaperonin GroEL